MVRYRLALISLFVSAAAAPAQVLDKQKLLDAQTFWDNRDWDWYKQNIPFFESPDRDLDTTYYYRWEVLTKHLTYGSPATGYVFTEFIDRPFWSGTYGAISCPAGHQIYEARWLRAPHIARDYARYWFRTPGAQPRRYSTWLADAAWAVHLVHPDRAFITDLLPDLKKNYQGWEKEHFVPAVGLFWQTGHDDGMELSITSRQTTDAVRGAPGYRPTLNSYLWADAMAIARIADLARDAKTAKEFATKAAALKTNLQKKLWDPKRNFFFHLFKQDEAKDGQTVKALTLTYQSGKYAGSKHGRELYGYVPWQFGLPDAGFEGAWRYLMDRGSFFADFGPTTAERHDPLFHLAKHCCYWSGQSWPYATTQTLKALANLLHDSRQQVVSKKDYFKLLKVYARTHRKAGRPYIAEACHPDTGSWVGHDSFNHSEHYFHSGYVDLIVTGLVGLRPRADEVVEVNPLAPDDWDYFALDDVAYHGHRIAVVWDRHGKRYGLGAGLHILAGGKKIASRQTLGRLTAKLPAAPLTPTPLPPGERGRGEGAEEVPAFNYAVNNEGSRYPRATASHTATGTFPGKAIDGNYWYHRSPPNRWTCAGSGRANDWFAIDFGIKRPVHTVKLYLLDDGKEILPPAKIALQYHDGGKWLEVPEQTRSPAQPAGRRTTIIRFPRLQTQRLRAVFTHRKGSASGLTEFEAWGPGRLPIPEAPPPAGNLALNRTGKGYPRATASFTSRYDKVEMVNDGKIVLAPSPHNRWTSYESPNASDWLEIDFGSDKVVGRIDLHVYDDGGGVQAPARYNVQFWDGRSWRDVAGQKRIPAQPAGGTVNTVTFKPLTTRKVRVVFTHRGKARSGLSEIEIWQE